jgi:hypothetical protein
LPSRGRPNVSLTDSEYSFFGSHFSAVAGAIKPPATGTRKRMLPEMSVISKITLSLKKSNAAVRSEASVDGHDYARYKA